MIKKKILIVDDEPDIVNIVKKMLGSKYDVITAYNGEECIKQAKREHPDIILMDILMPNMDGWETIKNLKSDPELKDILVSMLTALPLTPDDTKNKPIHHIENYIVKPFKRETLLKKINEIIESDEETQKIFFEIKNEIGSNIAEEYLRLMKAFSRHQRLIRVVLDSANKESSTIFVENLIRTQRHLLETIQRRMDDIEIKLQQMRDNK